jgi:hypothetical protein
MRQPSGLTTRRPTDMNMKDRDMLNPPVNPEIAKTDMSKLRAGKLAEKTIRAGRK